MKKRMLFLVFLAIVVSAFSASMARADATTGVLYYTTYAGGTNVWSVNYSYDGVSSFTLSTITGLAALPGADGILIDPKGNLIVGGQSVTPTGAPYFAPPSTPQLYEITTGGAAVTNVNAGTAGTGMGSYAVTLDNFKSNTAQLYNLWNGPGTGPTSISGTVLAAGGLSAGGVNYTVTNTVSGASTDVRGLAFDPKNSTWYYGTTPDFSNSGDFGTVAFNNTLDTAVLTPLDHNVAAHGLLYDSFSGDIIAIAGNTINQFAPDGSLYSSFSFANAVSFDNPGTDSHGHLFAADAGSGNLAFIDYDTSTTKKIGDPSNFTAFTPLATALDDITPTVGTPGVPEPISLILLGSGLVGAGLYRRMRKPKA